MKKIFVTIAIGCLIAAVASLAQLPKPGSGGGGGSGATYTFSAPLNESGGTVTCATCAKGMILLETKTASTSASLDFTACISAAYDDYTIRIIGLVPSTDGATLGLRVSTDGGMTYESTGYASAVTVLRDNAVAASNTATTTHILISNGQDTDAGEHWSGWIDMFAPGSAALQKFFNSHGWGISSADSLGYTFRGGGRWSTVTAVNAFQILAPSGGNLASGTVRCYGLAK